MSKFLITGATGNIGVEVIRFLNNLGSDDQIVAGVRNVDKAKQLFVDIPNLAFEHFDFEAANTFDSALKDVDRIFLLRPPHISNIEKYFHPLVAKLKEHNVNEVVFLSVQGADRSKVIPHNKIECLVKDFGLDYIFVRPSYFMQNLTTTLIQDIKNRRKIILPAGEAKFNWVDVENIGEVSAILLDNFGRYKNKAYDVTGLENKGFKEVVELVNQIISDPIHFQHVNPFKFYNVKKRDGMEKGMIIVMILLHFLPRFQKAPTISNFYEQLTGNKPTDLSSFVKREKLAFENALY